MKNILIGLSLAALMLMTACTDNTNFIYGDVIDKHENKPVEGCIVTLESGDGVIMETQTTGADGRWGFEVEEGTYAVAFKKAGYAPVKEEDIFIEYSKTKVKLIANLGESSSDVDAEWFEEGAAKFAAGDGSAEKPYIIKSSKQLMLVADNSDMHFRLVNDIDLHNKKWNPIKEFSGTFDGNGFTIHNLRVEDKESNGLFGTVQGTVKNLNIKGVYITGNYSGAIAGRAYNGATISNCKTTLIDGSLIRGTYAGGIVGSIRHNSYNDYFAIKNCIVESTANKAAIYGTRVGGIAGEVNINSYSASNSIIKECDAFCNIYGEEYVGGISGYVTGAFSIAYCRYNGNLSGTQYVGGITGYQSYSKTIGCKASGNIEGDDNIGGISGKNATANIIASYSNCDITASAAAKYIGGILGTAGSSKISLCYSTTICNHSNFSPISYDGTKEHSYSVYETKDIAEKMFESYSDYADYWDFDNIWVWEGEINGVKKQVRCPRLAWEM